MKVLHIVNSYGGTAVYTNLFRAIDALGGVQQTIYVPLNSRNHDRVGNKLIDFKTSGSSIHYSTVLKSYHKYLYTFKIRRIVRDIESLYSVKDFDIIHAGTVFFDGAVAYELSKKYGVPFISAVRDTDVNDYYQRLFYKRRYFHKVLFHCEKIVFISPRYLKDFLEKLIPNEISQKINSKSELHTNGVDSLFLENMNTKSRKLREEIHFLFTGAFIQRKGLLEAIFATKKLVDRGYRIKFHAVGRGLPNREIDSNYISKINLLEKKFEWLTLDDYKPLNGLIEEMNKADVFIMTSHTETFGLCYVEALTQGLPILYTEGQGFDGFYPEGIVGYAVDSHDEDDIAKKMESLIINYNQISSNIQNLDLRKQFDWNQIATRYIEMYNLILKRQ